MSTGQQGLTLNALDAQLQLSKTAKNLLRKELVTTYDEFVEVLYDELDLIIVELESNPQFYHDDSEDEITHHVISMLKMRNYSATQGSASGGSVDITVAANDPSWTWIGEAKIYTAIEKLREGFLQLTTRYRNASPNFAARGLLAYTKRQNPAALLKNWGDEVEGFGLPDFKKEDCNRRGQLAFFTSHTDKSSGLPVRIRHTAICLYHLPEDKSARNARKYKDRQQAAASAAAGQTDAVALATPASVKRRHKANKP